MSDPIADALLAKHAAELELAELRAVLKRVKALPAQWRQCEGMHCARCAAELDNALFDPALLRDPL